MKVFLLQLPDIRTLWSPTCDQLGIFFNAVIQGPVVHSFCLFSLSHSSRVQKNDFHMNLTAYLTKDVGKNIKYTQRGVSFSVDSWTSVRNFAWVGEEEPAAPAMLSCGLTGV